MFPMMFSGLVNKKISANMSKKKAAFLAGIVNGILLVLMGYSVSLPMIIGLVFGAGLMASIAIPEIMAVSEDLVSRLDNHSNDMVGLERSAVSLAYIIGPILAGLISSVIGHQKTFSVVGIMVLIVSILLFFNTPKKILLPQRELVNE